MIRLWLGLSMGRIGRPQDRVLSLSALEQEELERISRSRSAAHSVVRRAQTILGSASGESNLSILGDWASRIRRCAIGARGGSIRVSLVFTAKQSLSVREPTTKSGSRNCCAPSSRAGPPIGRIGPCALRRKRQALQKARLREPRPCSACDLIAPGISSCPPIPSSLTRSRTSSVCT
jgi:hypothetical protein